MIERLREEDVDAKKIGVALNKLKIGGVEWAFEAWSTTCWPAEEKDSGDYCLVSARLMMRFESREKERPISIAR